MMRVGSTGPLVVGIVERVDAEGEITTEGTCVGMTIATKRGTVTPQRATITTQPLDGVELLPASGRFVAQTASAIAHGIGTRRTWTSDDDRAMALLIEITAA